jgi:hypothetical protein
VNNVLFILLALAVAAVVIIGLWWRDRRPPSIEEGIDAFHRELEALAPESQNQPVRPSQQSPPEEGRAG